MSVYDSARSFSFSGGFGWGRVRSVKKTNKQKVYNFSVNEDESYIADGIAVHNCQPFSAAGKQQGTDDPRHLWPHLHRLISAVRPPIVMGEQVSGKAGYGWLDGVCDDLETEGYTCGAADIAACAIDAPHQRSRLWWYGHLENAESAEVWRGRQLRVQERNASDKQGIKRDGTSSNVCSGTTPDTVSTKQTKGIETQRTGQQSVDQSDAQILANTSSQPRQQNTRSSSGNEGTHGRRSQNDNRHSSGDESGIGKMADTNNQGLEGHRECDIPTQGRQEPPGSSANANDSYWGNHWIECYDGKARRTEPSICFLANGIQLPVDAVGSESPADVQETFPKNRIEAWRIAGNAIVPQLAVEFIKSVAN